MCSMTTPPFIQTEAEKNLTRLNERIQHLESLPALRFRTATRNTTTNTTLDHSFDGTLFVDPSGGVVTVTLPASTNQPARIFVIKDETGSAGSNNITIDTTGSETIDGNPTLTITTNGASRILQTDGSNWFVIGGYL